MTRREAEAVRCPDDLRVAVPRPAAKHTDGAGRGEPGSAVGGSRRSSSGAGRHTIPTRCRSSGKARGHWVERIDGHGFPVFAALE